MFEILRNFYIKMDTTFSYLRGSFWELFFSNSGGNLRIKENVKIVTPKNISVGSNVFINHHCDLEATSGKITIGDKVWLGMEVLILTLNHNFSMKKIPICEQ